MSTNTAIKEVSLQYRGYPLQPIDTPNIAVHRQFPAFEELCDDLLAVATSGRPHLTALDFMATFNSFPDPSDAQLQELLAAQASRHILIDNESLRVVVIRWVPGMVSEIHPHPAGGGIYKVLLGSVEELRYSFEDQPVLLAKNQLYAGSTLYIDDRFGQHAVGNPFPSPAISLHAYLKGS